MCARSSVTFDLRQCVSPRVRGNLGFLTLHVGDAGSIPARAGEPPGGLRQAHHPRVYPRACGGTKMKAAVLYPVKGLSPRVRGNLRKEVALGVHLGSIPARAGEPGS